MVLGVKTPLTVHHCNILSGFLLYKTPSMLIQHQANGQQTNMFGEKIQDERIHARSFLKTALWFLKMNRFSRLSTFNYQRFAQTNGGKKRDRSPDRSAVGNLGSRLNANSHLSALLNFIRIYHGCFAILISPTTAIHQRVHVPAGSGSCCGWKCDLWFQPLFWVCKNHPKRVPQTRNATARVPWGP